MKSDRSRHIGGNVKTAADVDEVRAAASEVETAKGIAIGTDPWFADQMSRRRRQMSWPLANGRGAKFEFFCQDWVDSP